jgi:hypothetical protein
MGTITSKAIKIENETYLGSPVLDIKTKCNNDCPVCQKSGKTPNMAGKFFLINDTQCKCNACETVFPKEQFYEKFVQ